MKTLAISANFLYFLFLTFLPNSAIGQYGNKILEYNTSVWVEKGKLITEKSFLIQINDKESDWLSDIRIPYDKNDDLDILKSAVVDQYGNTLRKLKKKEITTSSDISRISFFEDDYVKTFSLKWDKFPYRVHYSYRITSKKFIYLTHWSPLLDSDLQTVKASLQVKVPKDYPVRVKHEGPFTYKKDTLENTFSYSWEITNVNPVKDESFSPPLQEFIPRVIMVPISFRYGLDGSFESWESYGNWQSRMNTDLDILPESERKKVDRLLEGVSSPEDKIKKLYHFMQNNTRYVNVAIDVGGLKPYPASYVSENKYGDCKALTNYMKTLLKYAGIESFYTKVYAGENPVRIDESFPSQQFNHVILCVPLEEDTIWLENTVSFFPPDYLGTFTQNRKALIIDSQGSRLVNTPCLEENDVLEVTKYKYEVKLGSKCPIHIYKTLKGDSFENYRYYQSELSEKDQKIRIAKDVPFERFDILSWKFYDHPKEPILGLEIDLLLDEGIRKIGNSIVINPPPLNLPSLEKPAIRQSPVRINFPINRVDSIVFNAPFLSDYQTKIPSSIELTSKYGTYQEKYSVGENQIILIRKFILHQGNYSLEHYEDLYTHIESVKDSLRGALVVLNQKP